MSYYDYINCPYCNEEVNTKDVGFDGTGEIGYDCPNCKKECEVVRGWTTDYGVNAIEYVKCRCGKEDREDLMVLRGNEYLCKGCYLSKVIKGGS